MKIAICRQNNEQTVLEKALRRYYPEAEFVVIKADGELRGQTWDSIIIDEVGPVDKFFSKPLDSHPKS